MIEKAMARKDYYSNHVTPNPLYVNRLDQEQKKETSSALREPNPTSRQSPTYSHTLTPHHILHLLLPHYHFVQQTLVLSEYFHRAENRPLHPQF